jgi:hypothetical protein
MCLVHYPVYNRGRQTVATAITNLDIHDIARASCAYGVEGVLIVNPLDKQQWLLERILRHWREGFGMRAHPNRREALNLVFSMKTIEESLAWVESRCRIAPMTVATSARSWPQAVGYSELRRELIRQRAPIVVFLGTGWGLSDEVIKGSDFVLRPIMEDAPYNHLSVRSAAAIILDRLLGDSETTG